MSNTITCILCGQRKPGSMEDVIPRWVRKHLGITGDVTTRVGDSGQQRVDPFLSVPLRRVACRDCNNGWMSQLETKVKPYLGPMLLNEHPVDLDEEQQRHLARWAVMKVLLLELSARQQHSRRRQNVGYEASAAELAWLYVRDEPPPRSRVWIGAFNSQNTTVASTRARLFKLDMDDGSDPMTTHLTTLTVGCVLFQVFSIDYVTADSRNAAQFDDNPPEPFARALSRIWPIERSSVHWPPVFAIGKDVVDNVQRWSLSPER